MSELTEHFRRADYTKEVLQGYTATKVQLQSLLSKPDSTKPDALLVEAVLHRTVLIEIQLLLCAILEEIQSQNSPYRFPKGFPKGDA